MRNKLYPSEYLALLTVKYEVDSDEFFNALVSAWRNRRSEVGDLIVECRSKQDHKVTLLITRDSKVIAQFKIPDEFFLREKNPLKGVKAVHVTERYSSKKGRLVQSFQIKDLRVGMKRVKLEAKVVEVSEPRFVVTRFGNCASVANATVSDDTGKIRLCLWNDQISSVAVGDTVQIENASISQFKNERQLRVGKNGVLRIA